MARLLANRPSFRRFLARAPSARALARVDSTAGERARRVLRLLRLRTLVHTAAWEGQAGSPLVAARLWSEIADASIALADRVAATETARRFGHAELDGTRVGRAILALGKLGSRELNPSSDVDLLLVYARDGALDACSAHEWFTHWARRFRAILSDTDADGFSFRVDFDLRPEGTAGPLVNSLDALETYYERFGRTWERAALARARVVTEHGGVGSDALSRLRPFIFPRRVDAAAIDALFEMKGRVTSSAGADGFDVKRGHGGIREVEFVVQAMQLLHGGRNPTLRHGDVVTLLERLEECGLLPHRAAADLRDGYVFLRRVEHALQYGEDRQTQHLPDSGPERERVEEVVERALRRPGERPIAFEDALAAHRSQIHAVFLRTLGEQRGAASGDAHAALDRTRNDEERMQALRSLGFSDAGRALDLVRTLERRKGSPLAPTVSDEATRELAARLLDQVAASPAPVVALERLPDLFSRRLPRALLAGLRDDARALALFARLVAVSAPLSRLLVQHDGMVSVLLRMDSAPRLRKRVVAEALVAGVDDDDESRLVRMRHVVSEVTLACALPFFARRRSIVEAQLSLSAAADAVIARALAVARGRIQARHGAVPGARLAIIALGSLGGRELGFFRDVDLLFLYDGDGNAESDGKKPIGLGEHAGRTAQQVIWALSTPLPEGTCYAVDSRLRPSGSQGLLTTSLRAFDAYHGDKSALWERQALSRARFVAGDAALGAEALAVIQRAVALPEPRIGQKLLEMRARMVSELVAPRSGGLDVKLGEGGLADIEFAVQGLLLKHAVSVRGAVGSTRRALTRLARAGHIAVDDAAQLRDALDLLQRTREALSLVDDKRDPVVSPGDTRLDLLARAGVLEESTARAAWERIARTAAIVRELTGRILVRLD